jgi:putative ABC transport system permease protein
VAAVLAAATLASAGLVLSATQQTWMRDNHWWIALENQARLPLVMDAPFPAEGSRQPPMKVDPAELSSRVGQAVGAVAWTRVITAPAPIDCAFGPEADMTVPVRTENSNCILYSLAVPEEHECPMTPQRRVVDPEDWRCRGSMIREPSSPRGIVVGGAADIRMMLGTEAGAEALGVLDAGGMVVTNPVFVQDGQAVLQGQDVRTQLPSPSDGSIVHQTVSTTSLPAVAVEPREAVPYYGFVSPETAERLDLRAEPAELLVQLNRRPSAAEADAAAAAVAAVYKQPGVGFWAEPGVSQDNQWMFWLIVAASAVITLSAAGITTGLALADARNDHVTLAGVGASPRLRKGLAAAQALLTSGLGAALGTIAGVVPAVLIVASTDMRTAVEIPWLHLLALVLAVPLTGSALAWICTRAVLPMSRRGLVG